jgi:hypothetical protein
MSPRAKSEVKVILATTAGTSLLLAIAAATFAGVFGAGLPDKQKQAPAPAPLHRTGMMPEVVVWAKRPPELMAEVVVRPEGPVAVDAGHKPTSAPNIY